VIWERIWKSWNQRDGLPNHTHPGVVDAAIYQFCEALRKHPCFHVVAVPLPRTKPWRKQLLKATRKIWPFSQHESLGIFISLPLSRQKINPLVDLASALREVQYADHIHKWDLLREFLRLMRKLDSIPESVVRVVFQ
jgi:hypothetical protein